jgi:hypothetical protein
MYFQIPGWILAAVVLGVFTQWAELSLRAAIWIFLLWVAKDFVFYPFAIRSHEEKPAIIFSKKLCAILSRISR